jgi:signal transduction histidine kinase
MLSNRIVNAVKYCSPGGRTEMFLRKNADTVIWTIADTGIGIPEKDLPYIFDRFYRVDQSRSHKTSGSGLGLAIVQKIVEAHEGRIEVTSNVGEGTTFRVFLRSYI